MRREEIKKVLRLNNSNSAGISLSKETLCDLNVSIGEHIRYIVHYNDIDGRVENVSIERVK